ncbi:MAG: hypothetical protein KGQ52_13705 [Alphaproteobacteria bacterium]|nr:hypothetical protein [Alphaproteobacteria bacterium]
MMATFLRWLIVPWLLLFALVALFGRSDALRAGFIGFVVLTVLATWLAMRWQMAIERRRVARLQDEDRQRRARAGGSPP